MHGQQQKIGVSFAVRRFDSTKVHPQLQRTPIKKSLKQQ